MDASVRIGISSCLLGNNVRWNGGHQLDRYLAQTLGQFVEFVPVCPETECGLGIPRETMHLSGHPDNPRLVTSRTNEDKTDQMQRWAKERLKALAKEDLCGFIFKTKSPSSGMRGLRVFASKTQIFYNGVGIFARMFMDRFPRIPVEDDGRLHDPGIRENFIERIFTLRRWRDVVRGKPTLGKLVDFHTRHKLLILSHSQKHYRAMGPLVAAGKSLPSAELFDQYEGILLETLALKTTVKKQINVLMHILGYFKANLSADEKQEMLEIIDRYRNGFVPLVVPVTLINHYVRKYDQPYLKQQVYLDPHPVALKLRNHV
ncbi:MAG: DUF523 and DUF1722 domain-containing protein [Desulfobacterales bacterium]|nr:DUF523 and DUF1722 domain-containing protein [Desulfobacterales bacterium]